MEAFNHWRTSHILLSSQAAINSEHTYRDIIAVMASEKRAASENYSQMVVKRPNLGSTNNKALATLDGSTANGALVQAVSLPQN